MHTKEQRSRTKKTHLQYSFKGCSKIHKPAVHSVNPIVYSCAASDVTMGNQDTLLCMEGPYHGEFSSCVVGGGGLHL